MPERMNREQFFDRLAALDRQRLQKTLWTLYWRGSAGMRQRIEAELDAAEQGARAQPVAKQPVDPAWARQEVEEFVGLAARGPTWPVTGGFHPGSGPAGGSPFQRLSADAQRALRDPEPEDAAVAVEQLIDLACELGGYDYFRSEDPVEAARFVVSDAAALLWATLLDRSGFAAFAERAAAQLIRWESRYGWTRSGAGRVSEKETPLATVLARMLRLPDTWVGFADAYLDALDHTDHGKPRTGRNREQRSQALAEWHRLLLDQLADTEAEDRLDRLTRHPALAGPELQFLQARLAHRHGDLATAHHLMQQCLDTLPGHPGFLHFATDIDAPLPPRPRKIAADRHTAAASIR